MGGICYLSNKGVLELGFAVCWYKETLRIFRCWSFFLRCWWNEFLVSHFNIPLKGGWGEVAKLQDRVHKPQLLKKKENHRRVVRLQQPWVTVLDQQHSPRQIRSYCWSGVWSFSPRRHIYERIQKKKKRLAHNRHSQYMTTNQRPTSTCVTYHRTTCLSNLAMCQYFTANSMPLLSVMCYIIVIILRESVNNLTTLSIALCIYIQDCDTSHVFMNYYRRLE